MLRSQRKHRLNLKTKLLALQGYRTQWVWGQQHMCTRSRCLCGGLSSGSGPGMCLHLLDLQTPPWGRRMHFRLQKNLYFSSESLLHQQARSEPSSLFHRWENHGPEKWRALLRNTELLPGRSRAHTPLSCLGATGLSADVLQLLAVQAAQDTPKHNSNRGLSTSEPLKKASTWTRTNTRIRVAEYINVPSVT